jgi:hypothetical protein
MDHRLNLKDLTGEKFLKYIRDLESDCTTMTIRALPELGEKAPDCYEALGMTLALLDCGSSCFWGCKGGDHRLEYLIGRATSTAYAAVGLAVRGYYDQALSLARTLGEIGNLVSLFAVDAKRIDEWKTLDERTRKERFSAYNVRVALEKMGFPDVPINKDRYGRLSVYSIHAIPDQMPQAHGAEGRAIAYPVFQVGGFILALNEIALPVAFIALSAGKLLELQAEVSETFREIAHALGGAVGGIAIDVNGRPWFRLN